MADILGFVEAWAECPEAVSRKTRAKIGASFLTVTAMVMGFLLSTQDANAVCSPASAMADGQTINCTSIGGDHTTSIQVSPFDNVTINVDPGAVVTLGAPALNNITNISTAGTSGFTLRNSGTIRIVGNDSVYNLRAVGANQTDYVIHNTAGALMEVTAFSRADNIRIDSGGDRANIRNDGTIRLIGTAGSFSLINIIVLGDDVDFHNTGSMTVTGEQFTRSVDIRGSRVSIVNDGTITASATFFAQGIFVTGDFDATPDDGALIVNNGSVIATGSSSTGILVGSFAPVTANIDNVVVINNLGATVSGETGVQFSGLAGQTYRFENFGTVNATTGAGALGGASNDTMLNFGSVNGSVILDDGTDILLNAGLITGAVDLGAGDDNADLLAGSTTVGPLTAGPGSDSVIVRAAVVAALDGGDDASSADGMVDTLLFNGFVGALPAVANWEAIILSQDTHVSVGPTPLTLDTEVLTIDASSSFTAAGGGSGTYAVISTGTTSGNLILLGRLVLRDGAAGDRFVVGGNFSGGGRIALDAVLGGSGSPADRLAIGGDVIGTTLLQVSNVGGTGAVTGTGPGQGILVVEVGGTTAPGDFVLEGGQLIAGPYVYTLNLETDNNWYLQSVGDIAPTVKNYANLVSAAQLFALTELSTLHERLGELRHFDWSHTKKEQPRGIWFRSVGSQFDVRPSSGPSFDQTIWLIQIGIDDVRRDVFSSGDRLHLGVFGGYGESNTDNREADGRIRGWHLGLYATYYRGGFYTDLVLKGGGMLFTSTTKQPVLVDKFSGGALSGSLETGYSFRLGGRWVVEPQAQISYTHVWFRDFTDQSSAYVAGDRGRSLRGRIGLRIQKTFDLAEGQPFSPYLIANVVHEFLGDNRVLANGVSVSSDIGGTTYEVGAGATVDLTSFLAGYLSFKAGFGGVTTNYQGTAGIKLFW